LKWLRDLLLITFLDLNFYIFLRKEISFVCYSLFFILFTRAPCFSAKQFSDPQLSERQTQEISRWEKNEGEIEKIYFPSSFGVAFSYLKIE
jgi:hypothetical protein